MSAEIPTLDLRVSEFAPDREAATAAWATEQLRKDLCRRAERERERDAAWVEMARADKERLAELRLEAVKRGEVYIPPAPPPRSFPSASVSVNASGWVSATPPLHRRSF